MIPLIFSKVPQSSLGILRVWNRHNLTFKQVKNVEAEEVPNFGLRVQAMYKHPRTPKTSCSTYVYIYIYTYRCTIYIWSYMHIWYTYIYIHIYRLIHIYVHTYIYIYLFKYIYIYPHEVSMVYSYRYPKWTGWFIHLRVIERYCREKIQYGDPINGDSHLGPAGIPTTNLSTI